MKKSTVFKKIGFFAVTLMLVALMVVASVSLVAANEEYSDVKYSSASLSIDGSINLKFYITDLGSLDDVEGAYLAVRIPDEHGNYSVHKMTTDDLIENGNRHVLAVRLAAAQQTESISVQLIIPGANWSGKVFTYSISKYNNKVLELARDNENANQAAYKEVAIPLKAMLNYGAMAQAEFGYNTGNKANEGVYSNEDNMNPADVVGADHFKDVPGTEKTVVGDVQVAGIQAQYESEINAFVLIKSPLEKPVVTVKLEYEAAYTVRSKDVIKLEPGKGLDDDDGWYQVVIRNISAHALDRKMTITAKVNDNNQASLTCSMLNYFENLIVNTPEGVRPESVRTAQALYNFHMAMKSYMGTAPEVEVAECSHKDADGNLINYYIEVLAPATCQHAGRQIKVCSLCDEQIEGTEEQIAKAAHKYSTVVDTLPTCTAEGTQHKKCDNCDATMAMDNIPMLDHSFEDKAEVVTEATCTTDGVMTAKCKFCGTASEEQIVIPAFEHDFDHANSEITVEPGCTTAGERTYYCNNEGCNETKVEAVVALGHTYVDGEYKAPTCETEGSRSAVCACGDTITNEVIPATGHKYSKATCDTPATCTVCQATYGEALGHKTTKATCTAPEVCYVCKKVITEASGQDHDWGEGVIGAGKITYTCNECNATKAEPIVSFAIDPVYAIAGENVVLTVRLINNPGIWATRFEIPVNTNVFEFVGASGSMFDTYECGLEGNKIVYFAYNNAIANAYDEIVVQITLKTKADIHEGSQGSYQFKALPTEGNTTNVDKQVVENIQTAGTTVTIKGHNPETVPGKAMTCAEDGLTDGIVCKDCGMVIKAQEVIVASGHDAPEATCTENGVCTVCNQIVNPAPGHTFDPFTAACACGETADRGVNVVFEKNNLKDVATNDKYEINVTNDGVQFVTTVYDDSNITFFQNKGDVETGKYLFFKYKAEGNVNFQVFTATDFATPNGASNAQFKYTLTADGEWHIAVIDVSYLTATEGKYYVKQLRFDVEGEAGVYAEFAYVGYAADLADIAAFAGNEIADHCKHDIKHISTYVDVNTHNSVCGLCGEVLGTLSHAAPTTTAAWNASTNRYEYTCSECSGLAVTDWQWSRDYSDYEDGTKFSAGGAGGGNSVQNGVLVMTPNGNTEWGGASVGIESGSIGQYYVLKYRVPEGGAANDADTVKAYVRFNGEKGGNGGTTTLNMKADGKWHVAIIDIDTIGSITAENGLYESSGDHWFCNYADANLIKYEVAFEGCVDNIDRIPASILADAECDHVKGEELSVYEMIGNGTGMEYYAYCAICNEKVSRKITPNKINWDGSNNVAKNEVVSNGEIVATGWIAITGGIKETRYVITSVTTPGKTTTVVHYPESNNTGIKGATSAALGDNRGWARTNLTVADWANVNGVNFNGEDITIALYLVLRGDETAEPILIQAATPVKVELHEHTPGEAAEEVITAPTCTATGTKGVTTRCTECNAVISQTTEVVPATGHTAAGSDGEFCSVCRTFINADLGDYFELFWNSTNLPNGGAYKRVGDSGYNLYNITKKDHRTQGLISNANPTASTRYLVIKYKTDVAFQLGLFASSGQTGINGNHYLNTELTAGGWKYVIVDLTKTANSGVVANGDGKYLLQHLTVDYDWINDTPATAEIAFIALAATADDVVNGIKAIEGVEYINNSYCSCYGFLQKGASMGANTHAPVCQLCGKAGTEEAHRGATHGVWNGTIYESNVACTVCGVKYNFGSTTYFEAENITIGESGYNSGQSNSTEGDIGYAAVWSKNATGTWSQTRLYLNPNGVVTGQYLVFRYKVPAAISSSTIQIATDANGGYSKSVNVPINADGEWHIAIVDLAPAGLNSTSVFANASRITLNSLGTNETIWFDWFRLYDNAARIPDEYKPACEHANLNKGVNQGDGTHADVCNDCYRKLNVAAHTTVDTNGEFCSVCQTFVKADPTTLFNKFFGGTDFPAYNSANISSTWSANGYRLYNILQKSETYYSPKYDGSETGQFMVLKYRATGSVFLQFYTNTSGSGASGSGDYLEYKLSASDYGEWRYYIVDLSKLSKVEADENGKYAIKYLRFDIQTALDVGDKSGTGTLEMAYLAYANSLEKLVNGIKTLEGVDSILGCTHSGTKTALETYEVVGDGSGQEYREICDACGAKCGKATISSKIYTDHLASGTIAAKPETVVKGWVIMTGGVSKIDLVITDVETGEKAIVTVEPSYNSGIQTNSWAMSGIEKAGPNSAYSYNFSTLGLDFSQLETTDGTVHDFSGGQITFAADFYSLSDPDATAIVKNQWSRTLTVEAAN